MHLFNDTPFVAQCFEQAGVSGLLNAVVVARGSFVLEIGASEHFRRVDEASDKNWNDVFETTDRGTKLLDPGDMAPFKPGTDITIIGDAFSKEPRTCWPVALQVGAYRKALRVHGERFWEPMWKGIGRRVFVGWRMTVGSPSTRVPLTWENAFGGKRPTAGEQQSSYEANPVGPGLLHEHLSPKDQLIPAPQIEAEADPITDWKREYEPEGLAPVAPWWHARQRFSGTYDDIWQQTRSPMPPLDFKYDFWQAAPTGQRFRPWLFGDEDIKLSGLRPAGEQLDFALALQRIFCLTRYRQNIFTTNIMFLDGIHIVVGATHVRLRLSWRASFPRTIDLVSARLGLVEKGNATRAFDEQARQSTLSI